MIDLNNTDYLKELRKSAGSKDGQMIIEYLKYRFKQRVYELDKSKNYSEIGMDFAVCYNIKEELKKILNFLK
jgi:hypothetical protein